MREESEERYTHNPYPNALSSADDQLSFAFYIDQNYFLAPEVYLDSQGNPIDYNGYPLYAIYQNNQGNYVDNHNRIGDYVYRDANALVINAQHTVLRDQYGFFIVINENKYRVHAGFQYRSLPVADDNVEVSTLLSASTPKETIVSPGAEASTQKTPVSVNEKSTQTIEKFINTHTEKPVTQTLSKKIQKIKESDVKNIYDVKCQRSAEKEKQPASKYSDAFKEITGWGLHALHAAPYYLFLVACNVTQTLATQAVEKSKGMVFSTVNLFKPHGLDEIIATTILKYKKHYSESEENNFKDGIKKIAQYKKFPHTLLAFENIISAYQYIAKSTDNNIEVNARVFHFYALINCLNEISEAEGWFIFPSEPAYSQYANECHLLENFKKEIHQISEVSTANVNRKLNNEVRPFLHYIGRCYCPLLILQIRLKPFCFESNLINHCIDKLISLLTCLSRKVIDNKHLTKNDLLSDKGFLTSIKRFKEAVSPLLNNSQLKKYEKQNIEILNLLLSDIEKLLNIKKQMACAK